MSAASLLKVYDGQDPELAFQTAGPGGNQDLAQVLAVGASANDLAITDILSLTGGAGTLLVDSGVGQSLSLTGNTNALLVATVGDVTVEATAGNVVLDATATITLSAPSPAGNLILALPAGKLTAATAVAGNAITNTITQQLEITINGVSHFIPLSIAAFP